MNFVVFIFKVIRKILKVHVNKYNFTMWKVKKLNQKLVLPLVSIINYKKVYKEDGVWKYMRRQKYTSY